MAAESMTVCSHGGTDYLYVGTTNNLSSCEVWRTAGVGGPPYADWTLVCAPGFGDANNYGATSMVSSGSEIFVGTTNYTSGAELWRSAGVGGPPYTDWAQVNVDGFGDAFNGCISALLMGNGFIHAGTENLSTGCEMWRSSMVGGPSYTDWIQVNADGFGDAHNTNISSLVSFNGGLYAGTANGVTGAEIWKSYGNRGPPYADWVQANVDGFGNARNTSASSLSSESGTLYVGTANLFDGCELWSAPGARIVSVSPSSALHGRTLDIDIVGADTDFKNGVSQAVFSGSGITVNSTVVTDATHARANVTIEWDAAPGTRDVNVTTGWQNPHPLQDGFTVSSATWYLAEGSTDGGMETFLLVQNPAGTAAVVDITLQTDSGEVSPSQLQGVTIPAGSRRTFKLNEYVTTFNVSSKVVATSGQVICERAMYGDSRTWAHDSIAYSP